MWYDIIILLEKNVTFPHFHSPYYYCYKIKKRKEYINETYNQSLSSFKSAKYS